MRRGPAPRHRAMAAAIGALAFLAAACNGGSDEPDARPVGTTATTLPLHPVLHVEPNGKGDCTPGRACSSLSAALTRAAAGAKILMAAGQYPRQDIARPPGRRVDKNVVIEPMPGAMVTVKGLRIAADHLTFRGLKVEGGDVATDKDAGAHHVRLENMRIRGATVFFNNADHSAIVQSEIFGGVNRDGINVKDGSDDVLLERNLVHDMRSDESRNRDGVHVDCLQVFNASKVTIRENRFLNCAQRAVLVQTTGDVDTRQIVIANNMIGRCLDACQNAEVPFQATGELTSRSQNRKFKAKARDYRIVNNVIDGYAFLEPVSNLVFRNNVLQRFFHTDLKHLVCNTDQEGHNLVAELGACGALSPTDRLGWPALDSSPQTAELRVSPVNTVDLSFADPGVAPLRDYFGKDRCGPVEVGIQELGCA